MFGVEITSAGTDYVFLVDTEESIRELVNNSLRVSKVNVWSDKELRYLSNEEVCDLVGVGV